MIDLLDKKLAKEAKNYPRRDFGEKFNQKYEKVLQKAEQRKEELEIVSHILEEEMKGAADLSVELDVDMHEGNSWYEAK